MMTQQDPATGLPEHVLPSMLMARKLLGKTLRCLENLQYSYAGKRDKYTGDLYLQCTDGTELSLYLLSDGRSIGTALAPPEIPLSFENDAGKWCEWHLDSYLSGVSAPQLLGARIVAVGGLVERMPGQPRAYLSALKIVFESADYLIFFNCRDGAIATVNTELVCQPEGEGQWFEYREKGR